MARQRMVKPEFFDSPSLGKCSVHARFLFIGLWVQADDFGRLKYQPERLKARVFTYDRVTPDRVKKLLGELEAVGCIRFYEVDGERYIDIPNFGVYQTIQRPSKSTIPAPVSGDSWSTHGALNEHSMSTHPKERKKERSIKGSSKEPFNAKEEGQSGGAVGIAAPPSCPSCGKDMQRTGAHRNGSVLFRCECGKEVWS